uniref:Translation elongation factor EFTs/EF1B dimerisation domain-containing protein n=1 Tax=Babesia bovis TaxID=5865 RepID=A7APN5_BABBO|eukprot:XP_001612087.1 hypothetical protein [Babesia bovis T2Bo]
MIVRHLLRNNFRVASWPFCLRGLSFSYTTGSLQPQQQTEAIKQLRRVTRSGIVECKQALDKFNWDLDAAIQHIRRIQQESEYDIDLNKQLFGSGKIALFDDIKPDTYSTIIELSCNCDFVTTSREFGQLSYQLTNRIQQAIDSDDISIVLSDTYGINIIDVDKVNDLIYENDTTIGQKLQTVSAEYKRKVLLTNIILYRSMQNVDHTGVYLHHKMHHGNCITGDRLGIVTIRCESDNENISRNIERPIAQIARCLALQVVANPVTEKASLLPGENELIMDIKDILAEEWLQPDVVKNQVNEICQSANVMVPKFAENITVGDTLRAIQESTQCPTLIVKNALCMKIGSKPILYK